MYPSFFIFFIFCFLPTFSVFQNNATFIPLFSLFCFFCVFLTFFPVFQNNALIVLFSFLFSWFFQFCIIGESVFGFSVFFWFFSSNNSFIRSLFYFFRKQHSPDPFPFFFRVLNCFFLSILFYLPFSSLLQFLSWSIQLFFR